MKIKKKSNRIAIHMLEGTLQERRTNQCAVQNQFEFIRLLLMCIHIVLSPGPFGQVITQSTSDTFMGLPGYLENIKYSIKEQFYIEK